jgi:hypothetical protein
MFSMIVAVLNLSNVGWAIAHFVSCVSISESLTQLLNLFKHFFVLTLIPLIAIQLGRFL